MTLADIERVHFERVDFSLRAFDIVFIFRDYKRPVSTPTSPNRRPVDCLSQQIFADGR